MAARTLTQTNEPIMGRRLETSLSVALTTAAVVIAIVLVRREFFASDLPVPGGDPRDPPSYVEEWRKLPQEGIVVGAETAPVMVVQFSDLECPFCRKFHGALTDARRKWGDSVAYTFIHFPLSFHRNAYPAAKAAECAHSQGRFDQFVGALFAKQDSLGALPWASFAGEAGVPDKNAFANCMADTAVVNRIERGIALGTLLKVLGTPTVIVNGWRFATTPPDSQFHRVVGDLLDGREPFKK